MMPSGYPWIGTLLAGWEFLLVHLAKVMVTHGSKQKMAKLPMQQHSRPALAPVWSGPKTVQFEMTQVLKTMQER